MELIVKKSWIWFALFLVCAASLADAAQTGQFSKSKNYSFTGLNLNDTATTSPEFALHDAETVSITRTSTTWGSGKLILQISDGGSVWGTVGESFTTDGVNVTSPVGGMRGRIKVHVAKGSAGTFDAYVTVKE